ncbi:hypothetical protein K439DRAFT_1611371 [Ramaria rubella]|nr:hypothetical protein K439DRAFT_1611371 [Ramaria rubella]
MPLDPCNCLNHATLMQPSHVASETPSYVNAAVVHTASTHHKAPFHSNHAHPRKVLQHGQHAMQVPYAPYLPPTAHVFQQRDYTLDVALLVLPPHTRSVPHMPEPARWMPRARHLRDRSVRMYWLWQINFWLVEPSKGNIRINAIDIRMQDLRNDQILGSTKVK